MPKECERKDMNVLTNATLVERMILLLWPEIPVTYLKKKHILEQLCSWEEKICKVFQKFEEVNDSLFTVILDLYFESQIEQVISEFFGKLV